MKVIMYASLAGGVIIGSTSHLIDKPGAALVMGTVAGLVSSIGLIKLSPILEKEIKLYDSCGVNFAFGVPGLMGGLASWIVLDDIK
jgi:ammonium transporter Rh